MVEGSHGPALFGFLAVLASVFCYGTYFVPVKKYEIHDGLVYQWYQCNGIMLAGTVCALVRNNWGDVTSSPGFYVAAEGLFSGLVFQLANITATMSVKAFGLGNYYTAHQVTNLGFTFILGVFGPSFGVPANPPTHVSLAALGFIFVLLGVTPVMLMEKECPASVVAAAAAEEEAAAAAAAGHASEGRLETLFRGISEGSEPPAALWGSAAAGTAEAPASRQHSNEQAADAPAKSAAAGSTVASSNGQHPAAAAAARRFGANTLDEPPPTAPRREVHISFGRFRPPPVHIPNFRGLNAQTWDGTLERPRLGRDSVAEPLTPCTSFGSAGLVVKEAPDEPEEQSELGAGLEAQLLAPSGDSRAAAGRHWLRGLALSLLAGGLYSWMYIPLLLWKRRMKAAGRIVQGFDSFFSMCVGLYLASTLWLLLGGAWKRYRGERMEKSVLRPALGSGLIYAVALFSFLYSMMVLPYAVAYAFTVGGGLAVSLLWGTCVFGEASSPYNRRCVMYSFLGVAVGVVLLGISA